MQSATLQTIPFWKATLYQRQTIFLGAERKERENMCERNHTEQ